MTRFSREALLDQLQQLPEDWALVPVQDKRGYLGGWQKAGLPREAIAAEIRKGEANGVGVLLGRLSGGLVATDFDGATALQALPSELPYEALPKTVAMTSGRPGRHQRLYRVPQRYWDAIRTKKTKTRDEVRDANGQKLEDCEQLELRWAGCQSVVIGYHPDTRGMYRWVEGCAPWEVAIAEAPLPLIEMMLKDAPSATRSKAPERPRLRLVEPVTDDAIPLAGLMTREHTRDWESGVGEGSRDDTAIAIALDLLGAANYCDQQRVRYSGDPRQLLDDFADRCSPPLSGADIERIWRSAERMNPAPCDGIEKRVDWHRRRQQQAQGGAYEAREQQQGQSADEPEQECRQRFQKRPDTQVRWGKRNLSFQRRMECLDRCVAAQAKAERNTFRRRTRLLKATADLELSKFVSRADLGQKVLAAKDQAMGNCYRALTAEERAAMEWPDVEWLIPHLLPAGDLSIIGGRPKVGKTSLAMAIAAAVLTATPVAGFQAPAEARPVLLVTDDQGDADTCEALQRLGVFDHPQLFWSRQLRLTEEQTDNLLEDIRNHPGALVIIDSLRSVSRSLTASENDPELGAMIYDLKGAVTAAGGSLVLIHHCNKAEGLIGVEALSGHSAIAGAANTVVTLHHVEDDWGKPNKQAPQRRMVREGRTGQPLDLVIQRDGAGFSRVSTYTEWQAQAHEATARQKREERRTELQLSVLNLFERHPQDRQWSVREVVEGLDLTWEDRGQVGDGHRVRMALQSLCRDGELAKRRVGREDRYALADPSAEPALARIVLKTIQHTQRAQHPLQDSVSDVEDDFQHPQHGEPEPDLDVDVEHVEKNAQHAESSPRLDVEDVEHVEAETEGGASGDVIGTTPMDLQLVVDPEQNAILLQVFREHRDATDAQVLAALQAAGLSLDGPTLMDLRMTWEEQEEAA